MIPNLLQATQKYWRKLDELEAAYRRGEVSLQEVDDRVEYLMGELGRERRAAFNALFQNWSNLWSDRRETILGIAFLLLLTYAWILAQ
ncbi:hypothetical protein [Phormidium sp. CCY1219]|jgi:DNA-binding HxlR family transcriptional regulator|uniref:hypothetical protein n=1 Tax=Phormidium sp. CCY1219 TaxID=2886104 RepID=UPI002D1F0246|nr:hypothetical protein [Phormidium sp. CCY1219]MEB3828664.1 hypothetical protein [Phormidium sp. CCY1219]